MEKEVSEQSAISQPSVNIQMDVCVFASLLQVRRLLAERTGLDKQLALCRSEISKLESKLQVTPHTTVPSIRRAEGKM